MKDQLHVGLVTTEFPPMAGGLATYYGELASQLAAVGQRVTVISSTDLLPDLPANGLIKFVSIANQVRGLSEPLMNALRGSQPELVSPISIGMAIRHWLKSLKSDESPDVLEAPDFLGYTAFMTESDLPPLAITCHGCLAQIAWHEQLNLSSGARSRIALEWLGLLQANGLSALSPANSADVSRATGREVDFIAPPWRVHTKPLVSELKLPSGPCGVVAARLQNWKGPEDVCLALRHCAAKGVPWKIEWCGRDTPTGPSGESMAAYLARTYPDVWGKYLIWHDEKSRAEVEALRQQSWCSLIPSRWDTLNYTVFEAMNQGHPVVVSSGAGASHWCCDGENALVFPAGNANRMADALIKLASEDGLRERIATAGRKTVLELSSGQTIQKRLEFYRRAISRRSASRQTGWCQPDYTTMLTGLSEPLVEVLGQLDGKSLLKELGSRVARKISSPSRRKA